MLTHGELFAGIGGFSSGFAAAGIRTAWAVEIDPDAQRVLRRHLPDALLLPDVRECGKHNLSPVDIVSFGSPCQDLSVAGKRKGLAGGRSGLFHEAMRIVDELRPSLAVLENVPGLLSSNRGRDFARVLRSFHELGARDVCWRTLDARHFGVAQRRRRVFVVADFAGERAAQVLFEPSGGGGHPTPGRAAGPDLAPGVTPGARRASGRRAGEQLTVARTVSWRGWGMESGGDTANAIRSGGDGHTGDQMGYVLTHALTSGGADASEDGTGRGTPLVIDRGANKGMTGGTFISKDICPAQVTAEPHAVAFQERGREGGRRVELQADLAYSLNAPAGGGRRQEMNVNAGMVMRRLTPVECLRLMGQPDDYLDLDPPLSDSAKYRLIGNSVVKPVAAWLGRRIALALKGDANA